MSPMLARDGGDAPFRSSDCTPSSLTVIRRHSTLRFDSIRSVVFALALLGSVSLLRSEETISPLAPSAARAGLEIVSGYAVELVAHEPEVTDPVAIAFDAGGRLWVVEMGDYPWGPASGEAAGGRVKVLHDDDGDGFFERATLFASQLRFPTGLALWRRGAYVTTERELLYLEDYDGDSKADHRRVLFSGFVEKNSQLLPSHPTLAIDNWIYVGNGLRNTDVSVTAAAIAALGNSRSPEHVDGTSLSIRGRDFRFLPQTLRLEAASGLSQFGMSFDDEGRRFVCTNRQHLRFVVLPDRYVRRNEVVPVAPVAEDVSADGAPARLFPISKNWTTSNLHAGTFTAACGVHVYRGGLLPALRGDGFTCDPTANVVHRERLEFTGSTYVGYRQETDTEFLRTADEWFRPVNLATGADGALYVVDMYRAVIEHPAWMPPELKDRPDVLDGQDRGRIYRIVPATAQRDVAVPRSHLATSSAADLVAALGHPNAWTRATAQRLLVERGRGDVKALERIVRAGAEPLGRLHALWTLEGWGALVSELIEVVCDDPDPRLRRAALRLAESHLAAARGVPESNTGRALRESVERLQARVVDLTRDNDRGVRFQAALTLGELPRSQRLPVLVEIARRDGADSHVRSAVISSASALTAQLALAILEAAVVEPPHVESTSPLHGTYELVSQLSNAVGRRLPVGDGLAYYVQLGQLRGEAAARWRIVAASRCAEGLIGRGVNFRQMAAAGTTIPRSTSTLVTLDRAALEARIAADAAAARAAVADTANALEERECAAILLAATSSFEDCRSLLSELLLAADAASGTAPLRPAVLRGLAAFDSGRVAPLLMESWARLSPAHRRVAADLLTRGAAGARAFVDAVERGVVAAAEVPTSARASLERASDAKLRGRAAKLFARRSAEDRSRVLRGYSPALALTGDKGRGRAVFTKNCATCHRVAGIGTDVGPDISDTRTRSRESILVDILDPNRAVDGNYLAYALTLVDGRVLSGVLAEESANFLTVRQADGVSTVLSPEEVAAISTDGTSFMPEGLERELDVPAMADLIAFLKEWRFDDSTPFRRQ